MFIIRVASTIFTNVAASILALAAAAFVSRSLGPEGQGVVAGCMVLITLVYTLVNMGMNEAGVYFIGSKKLTTDTVTANGVLMTMVAGSIGGLLALLAAVTVHERLTEEGVPYWLLPFALALLTASRFVQTQLQATNRIFALNATRLADTASRVLMIALLALAGALTIALAVAAALVSLFFATIVSLCFLGISYLRWRPLSWLQPDSLRRQFSFGARTQIRVITETVGARFDLLVLLAIAGSGAAGIYSVAVALSEAIRILSNSAGTALTPLLLRADTPRAGELTALVVRNAILLMSAAALALAVLAPIAVPKIFGAAFSDAYIPLLWSLPGTVALGAGRLLNSYFFATARPLIGSYVMVTRTVALLALDAALIPLFGATGAAMAATIASLIALGLALWRFRELSGHDATDVLLPNVTDVRVGAEALRTIRDLRTRGPAL